MTDSILHKVWNCLNQTIFITNCQQNFLFKSTQDGSSDLQQFSGAVAGGSMCHII